MEARIQRGLGSLSRLKRIASLSWEEFSTDRDILDIAERNMHILLEVILDLASFIVARRELARATTYKEVMRTLISEGIIPKNYSRLAIAMPGLRNILVHMYADINYKILYDIIVNELNEVEKILNILINEVEKIDP